MQNAGDVAVFISRRRCTSQFSSRVPVMNQCTNKSVNNRNGFENKREWRFDTRQLEKSS